MNAHFRPQFEVLEGRDVPAAFSFQFYDGTTGFGEFATPADVDPSEASQNLLITDDLTLTSGGQAYAIDGAIASYAYGVLTGVTATAYGVVNSDQLDVGGAWVSGDSGWTTVTYDATDAQVGFTLPDGTTGAISYTTPYDQIDPTQASQSLALSAFNLNIAGQNFAYGSASYTTAPTLQFEYGHLVGVTFAVDTSAVTGFPYASISGASGTITAIDIVTSLPLSAPAKSKNASVVIDFNAITIPTTTQGEQEFSIRVTATDGTQMSVSVMVKPGDTKTEVRDKFEELLVNAGFKATAVGSTMLDIKGTTGANPSQLKKVETFNFGYTGDHPKLLEKTPSPDGVEPTYSNVT
jgi:hypothetical protein